MVRANTLTWEDIQRERGPKLSILTFLLISLLPPDSPHYYPMKWSHVRYNLQDNMKHTYFFIVESACVFLMPFPLLSPLILIATMKGKTYSLSWAKIWMSIWVDITDSIYFSQFWSLGSSSLRCWMIQYPVRAQDQIYSGHLAGRNINNLRYADDTTLMAESKEELMSLLM